jgi:nucleotide-binding universal stress UspA family protein
MGTRPRDQIETVVVPLDGSELAARALGPARALADALGARIVLVTTHWEDGMGAAQQYLADQVDDLSRSRVETIVVHDRAAPDAIRLETQDPGAVLCMSTHGRGGLARTVLGSVAEEVIRAADHPVLLVGPNVDASMTIERGILVVGVDGSEASEQSLPTVQRFARLLDLEPWVVQVLPAGKRIVETPRTAESAYVRELARRLVDGHRPACWRVLHALDPADALAADARRLRATLLAVATHGRTGLGRVVLGSVAVSVVRQSHCPVLVTPARRR